MVISFIIGAIAGRFHLNRFEWLVGPLLTLAVLSAVLSHLHMLGIVTIFALEAAAYGLVAYLVGIYVGKYFLRRSERRRETEAAKSSILTPEDRTWR